MRSKKYLIPGFLINGITSLIATSFLIKNLNASSYILLSMSMTAITIISAASFQWLRVDLLRNLPLLKNSISKKDYFQQLGLKMLLCFFSVGLACFLFLTYPLNVISKFLVYVLLAAILQGLYDLVLIYFRSFDMDKSYAFFNSIRAIVWLLSVFFCTELNLELNFYIVGICIAFFIPVVGFCARHKQEFSIGWHGNFSTIVSNVKDSVFSVVNVVSPLIVIFILKAYVAQNHSFFEPGLIKSFDLLYLVAGMLFTAVNLMYQTNLVRNFDPALVEIKNSGKYFLIFLVAPLVFFSFFFFLKADFLSNFGIATHLMITDGFSSNVLFLFLVILFSKSHWLDHAFYLKKSYLKLSLTYLLPLILFLSGYAMLQRYELGVHWFFIFLLASSILGSFLTVYFEYKLLMRSMFLTRYVVMISLCILISGVVNV